MLQNRSVVQVVDNTEVLEIRCFQPRSTMTIGDLVTGSVIKVSKDSAASRTQREQKITRAVRNQANTTKTTQQNQLQGRNYKRGDVVRAVIVNCRHRSNRRTNGRRVSFGTNACVLRTHAGKEGWVPVGTRVTCAVPRALLRRQWGNIVARAESSV